MKEEKRVTVMERIDNMNRRPARTAKENEQALKWQEYDSRRADYWGELECFERSVDFPCDLRPLKYPELYFYLKDPKKENSEICAIGEFRYGRDQRSNRITAKTFPFFLKNQCMVSQFWMGDAERLFRALECMLRAKPQSALDVLLENVKRCDPYLAGVLQMPNAIRLSREKNLYMNNEAIRRNDLQYTPHIRTVFQPLLAYTWGQVPLKLQQKVFRAKARQLSLSGDGYIANEASRAENTLVFRTDDAEGKYIEVRYQPNADSFERIKRNWESVDLKSMPLYHKFGSQAVSENLYALFSALCGDNLAAVDSFAKLLSAIMDPALPGMTIIYTKQHREQLQDVLSVLLREHVAEPAAAVGGNVELGHLSLNRLAKYRVLRGMYILQSEGKSAVFIRDLASSEKNLRVLKKLIAGKQITLYSANLPPQYYFNRQHIICVSDDYTRVKALKKQFKAATLIDLSVCEQKTPFPDLSERDYSWLRSKFLLYGLKLRTLEYEQLSDPAWDAESEATPNLATEIEAFLDECVVEEGLYCNTHELYEAFCSFYESRHGETAAEATKIKFNKAVRLIIGEKYKRLIEYKKIRIPTGVSWNYVGMGLPKKPFSAKPKQEFKLQNYLAHINTYGLRDDFIPVRRAEIKRLPENAQGNI